MKKKWWRSLQVKIIAWSFVPTVIILSAVAWFTFYSYQKVLGDLAIKQDWAVVHAKADQAHETFAGIVNSRLRPIIFEIDTNPGLALEARALNIIDQAQSVDIFDGGMYFVDQQGKVVVTNPERPELIGQDWSDTPQFRFARDNPSGSAPLTDIRAIGEDGLGIVCAMWPMHNHEAIFIGSGYYCFSIESSGQTFLYKLWNGLSLGQTVYVVDGTQRIIFSPDISQIGRDLSGEAAIQQLLQGEDMSIRYQDGTEDVLISYDPLATVIDDRDRWVVISEQSWSAVMQPTLPYRQLLLVLLTLGVIVPVLVTAYGVRHLTGPIQKMILAAEQVTAGRLRQRIKVSTGDEIETLANQFNLMSEKLDDSYASLEQKVADRTRELAVLNSTISVASYSLDIQDILEHALEKTVDQMRFDAGAAFRLESDQTISLCITLPDFDRQTALDLANNDPVASLIKTQDDQPSVAALAMEDFPDGKTRSKLTEANLQQLLYVPLSTKGQILGFFLLGNHERSSVPPEALSLLNSIGQQIGVAMENARLYEQAQQTAITGERHRLARELHDAVTQTLFSANLVADVIPRIWKRSPEEALQNLEELRQLTRGALAEMRTLLLEMRPEALDRSDIKSLLTQLAEAFTGRVRVPVSLLVQGDCELTHEVKVVFYRVAQEAFNNIAKHSGAQHVDLHLECQPGQIQMHIKDDGLGFEAETLPPGHMGMAIMHERASSIGAVLRVDSQVGQGTTVDLDCKFADKG